MYYLDYISSALNVPLYYVLGNHHADSKRQEASYGRGAADWDCGNNLHQRFRRFEDSLLFLGMEGSIRYNYGPAQYNAGNDVVDVLTLRSAADAELCAVRSVFRYLRDAFAAVPDS